MIRKLNVLFEGREVGTLALNHEFKVAFQYSDEWIRDGFSISPFSLPLRKDVFLPSKHYFQGLFGVFGDSLPDAWGSLLMERFWVRQGYAREELTAMERLAMIGDSGMGALCYHPANEIGNEVSEKERTDLDEIARDCNKVLNTGETSAIDELYRLGGSSGGTRPKVMMHLDHQEMIIKFPAKTDLPEAGKMEYEYSLCAKACGIHMMSTTLLPSKQCSGYFGTERFDRFRKGHALKRLHVLTAAALLEIDYEQPALDYHSLMKLTKILTRDHAEDVENLYLRMCFNVLAHNRDDHAKNFSYLYQSEYGVWRLAPAYDLTYSDTYFGEHTTSVDGNGKNPGKTECVEVGVKAGIKKKKCIQLYEMVEEKVHGMLGKYFCS